MRGVTATASDFYFGAGPATTAGQERAGAPADPTTTSSIATASAPTPKANIDQVNLLPALRNVNPLVAIPFLLGLIVVFKLVREAGHKSSDFHAVRVDLYWYAMTVLAAATGIPLVKAIANKYRVQPVTDYLNNA